LRNQEKASRKIPRSAEKSPARAEKISEKIPGAQKKSQLAQKKIQSAEKIPGAQKKFSEKPQLAEKFRRAEKFPDLSEEIPKPAQQNGHYKLGLNQESVEKPLKRA
jgi:hypothetical protein